MKSLPILLVLCLVLISNSARIKDKIDNLNKQLKPIIEKVTTKEVKPETFLAETSLASSLDVTSITISAPEGDSATLAFNSGATNEVDIVLDPSGTLEISSAGNAIITIAQTGDVTVGADLISVDSISVSGSVSFGGVSQWRQVINENFWGIPTGWSNNEISVCGGVYLLGGYKILSRGQLQKEFSALPAHTTIRITATFFYIDAWNGETAYLQLNVGPNNANEYVWIDRYDSTMAVNSINICGATYGEGRFGVPIDYYLPHTSDSITVTFGSTADQDPAEQSWGISNLSIYVM